MMPLATDSVFTCEVKVQKRDPSLVAGRLREAEAYFRTTEQNEPQLRATPPPQN